MSAAAYFLKKCADKIEENIALTLAQLSDPASFVQIEMSDALAAAASGDMGALQDLASTYVQQNADVLLLQALQVTGLENTALNALNLFFNMMAQAISAYNDLILLFMKKVAENIIVEVDKKEEINQNLKQKLINLLNGLLVLTSGDPVFEAYLRQLRAALIELDQGRRDIVLVRNTIDRTGRFLGKKYKSGKASIESAALKIKPLDNNPYLQPTASALANNLGLPSTDEQINNLLAIPVLCKEVIVAMKDYDLTTLKINAMLVAYYAALNVLQTGMPDLMKKYLLSRFDSTLTKLQALINSMALNLNGQETAIGGPIGGFQVTPLNVSVQAFKWSMDVNLVLESFKLIPSGHVVIPRQNNGIAPAQPNGKRFLGPTQNYFSQVNIGDQIEIFAGAKTGTYRVKAIIAENEVELDRVLNNSIQTLSPVEYEITSDALGALELNFQVVDVYKRSVANLKSLGTITNGSGALIAEEAQENTSIFGAQLLSFLLKATAATVSAKLEASAISQCRGFIRRCDLVTDRGNEIKAFLRTFINTPIPLEETLAALQEGLMQALSALGLDKAADLLKEGKFAEFFGLDGQTATYVGAALAAIALLKECFDNDADQAALSEIENEIQGDADLLSISVSFNFSLAIFDNLQDCLDLTAFASLLNAKEIICGLLELAGVGDLFNDLQDLLSF